MTTLTDIRAAQRRWADQQEIPVDANGYTRSLRDNLFQGLTAASLHEFEFGDGSELGRNGERGKMQALHSSSALACNAFDYWRGRDASALGEALGLSSPVRDIHFERKFPTGVGPRSPNLDVVLECANGGVVAIESKFCEPYYSPKALRLSDKYFPEGKRLWDARGLPGCQALAEALREGRSQFERLDAAQLLKHMLGLGNSKRAWTLVCLWFDYGSPDAALHRSELDTFASAVNGVGTQFSALTYQQMFSVLGARASAHELYLSYMQARYFP